MTCSDDAGAYHASGTIWFKPMPDIPTGGWFVVPISLDSNNRPVEDAPDMPKAWSIDSYPTEQEAHEKARQIALHWRKMHP